MSTDVTITITNKYGEEIQYHDSSFTGYKPIANDELTRSIFPANGGELRIVTSEREEGKTKRTKITIDDDGTSTGLDFDITWKVDNNTYYWSLSGFSPNQTLTIRVRPPS